MLQHASAPPHAQRRRRSSGAGLGQASSWWRRRRREPPDCEAEEQAEETVTHGAHTIKVAASWRVGIGGKTWSTGALACKHLAAHAERYKQLAPARQLRVLELGAGTGLFYKECSKPGTAVEDAVSREEPW